MSFRRTRLSSLTSIRAVSCPAALERRLAPGRRSQGRGRDRARTQTLATITIQNYFRLYEKLAGMTGTGKPRRPNFSTLQLGVLVIPTNEPCIRKDANDAVYKTRRENSTPSLMRSSRSTPRAGPSSSVRFPLKLASSFHACSSAKASFIPCSTQNTTSRKPKSSCAPASAAR